MSEITLRLEKAIQRVNLIYGLLIPIVIGVAMGRILSYFDPTFFKSDATANYAYITVFSLGMVVIIIHLFNRWLDSGVRVILFYLMYILGLGILIVFMDPFPTPFFFQCTALLIAVDLLFGKKWMRLTIAYFTFILIASVFTSNQKVTGMNISLAILYSLGAASVAILVSKYRTISDEEREIIDKSSKQTAFERQRLLSLINNMGEAVMATDQNGKIVLYNAAVLNLLDTNQTLEDKSVNDFLQLKDEKGKSVLLTDILGKSQTGSTHTNFIHEFSPGDFINMYINIASVKLGFKEETETGFIVIMRDITKEKSLEEERDEFISVVSHELRTPVTVAEGNISNAMFAMNKNPDPKLMGNALKEAHDQVVFLANMINDLATLSRAERTDTKMEIAKLLPDEFLHMIARDYKNEADTKGLKFTVTAAKGIKPIQTSELYLREVLQNFITNSLKYTKEGSVIVHVRSGADGAAIFSVADTGIGLSKSDQKRIFEKFFRSEDYRTRESSGTGLGLYVTLKLAHRLKATIDVESQLNKGSTFTITVPSLKK